MLIVFEETKRLLQRAQNANFTLGELSDQRGGKAPLLARVVTAIAALSCLAALLAAAIIATR